MLYNSFHSALMIKNFIFIHFSRNTHYFFPREMQNRKYNHFLIIPFRTSRMRIWEPSLLIDYLTTICWAEYFRRDSGYLHDTWSAVCIWNCFLLHETLHFLKWVFHFVNLQSLFGLRKFPYKMHYFEIFKWLGTLRTKKKK